MNARLAYLCEECREIAERCPRGHCEVCGSEAVWPLEVVLARHAEQPAALPARRTRKFLAVAFVRRGARLDPVQRGK